MSGNVAAMEARELVKQYKGSVRALSNASFRVEPGESIGYLGPNGAGKSTTIKIFTTLIQPTSGKALINGYDVSKNQKKALASTGSLVEVPGLYDYLTPLEMLAYIGKIYGMNKVDITQRSEEIMKAIGLGDWMDKRLRTFSTGMRRRYSIGQAVLHDPDLVILDEPVLGLDPAGIREIRYFLQGLKKDGKSVFLSSHLLGEVEEVCDRVLLVNHGQILAEERLSDLRESLKGGFMMLYTGPPPQAEVESFIATEGVSGVFVEGPQVKITSCTNEGRIAIAKKGVIEGSAIGMWPLTPSLEEMYMRVIDGDNNKAKEQTAEDKAANMPMNPASAASTVSEESADSSNLESTASTVSEESQ